MELSESQKQKRREAVARYREKNREKENERQREYRKSPEAKEKHRLSMIEWRKNNPEKQDAIRKKNYEKNKDRMNEKRRLKYKNDPEYAQKVKEKELQYKASGRRQEMHRKRHIEKRDEILKKAKDWKDANRDYVKAYVKGYRKNVLINREQEQRGSLSDCYVIKVIKKQFDYNIHTSEIPKEIIELKKKNIELKRLIKNKNHDKDSPNI